jgi:hypothetical protein
MDAMPRAANVACSAGEVMAVPAEVATATMVTPTAAANAAASSTAKSQFHHIRRRAEPGSVEHCRAPCGERDRCGNQDRQDRQRSEHVDLSHVHCHSFEIDGLSRKTSAVDPDQTSHPRSGRG